MTGYDLYPESAKMPILWENLNAPEKIIINQGGTSCFAPEQLIVTSIGSIPISKIKKGDLVLCRDINKGINDYKPVVNTFVYLNEKKTIRVKLKNGKEIIATEDHLFFYKNKWVPLIELLKIYDNGTMETNSEV